MVGDLLQYEAETFEPDEMLDEQEEEE